MGCDKRKRQQNNRAIVIAMRMIRNHELIAAPVFKARKCRRRRPGGHGGVCVCSERGEAPAAAFRRQS